VLLQEKVVAVSGVGAGLGRAMAADAASQGASVVCIARSRLVIDGVVAEIAAAGGEALAVTADVASPEQCQAVAAATEERFGRLDGLINSAFTPGEIAPLADGDPAAWRNAFEVNVLGTLHLVRAFLPQLRAAGGGAVVNVNTASALRPMHGQGAYGGSKAAMEFLTRQLAVELGPDNIRCNTVYCGPMAGPSLDMAFQFWAAQRALTVDQVAAEVAATHALQRIPTDDEVARTIVTLLSERASAMTGAAVAVTGGFGLEQRL
jgi:NAD(P)-dependent dehydrogenase (short-subunit alcohol dehydrogenase family)